MCIRDRRQVDAGPHAVSLVAGVAKLEGEAVGVTLEGQAQALLDQTLEGGPLRSGHRLGLVKKWFGNIYGCLHIANHITRSRIEDRQARASSPPSYRSAGSRISTLKWRAWPLSLVISPNPPTAACAPIRKSGSMRSRSPPERRYA